MADAEDTEVDAFAVFEAKVHNLSNELPLDPSEWPAGLPFALRDVLAYRSWERECTFRERRAALGMKTPSPRSFRDFHAERQRTLAAPWRDERW